MANFEMSGYADETLDAHAWCEDKDGKVVFDPHFKEYDLIKKIRDLEGEPQYEEVSTLSRQVMVIIKRQIKDAKRQGKQQGIKLTSEMIMTMFLEQPAFGNCFLNAYAYRWFNPEVKMRVGKMGWKVKKTERCYGTTFTTDKVFWEYG